MYRWKTTKDLLTVNQEYFSEEVPPSPKWHGNRPISVEDVDIWEVITEMSGPIGVYASWCPYDELYIVTNKCKIVAEFSGIDANNRLEQYLIKNKIPYPKSKTI